MKGDEKGCEVLGERKGGKSQRKMKGDRRRRKGEENDGREKKRRGEKGVGRQEERIEIKTLVQEI